MSSELIAGRYRVERAVGRGGMGTVWLCQDTVLGREVAVKQVGRLPGETATDSARAMREARSSAGLNHSNVVSVFDVVVEDDNVWLVMEYVPSRTLGQIMQAEVSLTPQRAARIGAQVADGLAAAHAFGTIHRDVKPGNILVGEGDRAKISDFGIARTAGDSQLTQTGLLTGTPTYFSPELARGDDAGPAADVWALGATLYAAVEGEPPYPPQRNALALLQVIAHQPPPRPQHAGPLTEVITRMMDPDPTTRWSMADAAHALRRVARGQGGTTAAAAAPAAESPTPAREREEHVVAAPLAAPASTASPARERRNHRAMLPWIAVIAALVAVAGIGFLLLGLDSDETPAAAPTAPSSPATSPSEPSSEQSEPEPSETTSSSPRPSQSPQDPARAKVTAVNAYFGTVPGNLDAGWSKLAPSMQSVGRSSYEEFWGSISSVRASGATAVPGTDAVEVNLTYTFRDGRVVAERQRLVLQQIGGEYLIADDQVLSSRTVRG
jgi:serine/threonine protein kinase